MHTRPLTIRTALALGTFLLSAGNSLAGEWSGDVATQWNAFVKEPQAEEQHRSYLSVSAQPEFYHEWKDGSRSFQFESFARISQYDSRRTRADIRELNFGMVEDSWELTAGISKVFWGMTESQHLVDIINQDDLVENTDGEDKLGQPMLNLALVNDVGTLDLFVLPGFRPRTFAGPEGRPRFSLNIADQNNPEYESGAKEKHVDLAARWFQLIGDWEVAISQFRGTSRDPGFITQPTGPTTAPQLVPFYSQINHTGIEVQGVFGAWLWKFEGIRVSGFKQRGIKSKSYFATDFGFEYTLVLESGLELGALMEYNWDERGRDTFSQLQNDVLVGTRLTLNDIQSTQILAGVLIDAGGAERSYNIEAERRIGDNWKLSLEARGVFHVKPEDFLYQVRRDNSLRFNLARYF